MASGKTYQSLEDASIYSLDPARQEELLEKQFECVLIWSNREQHPLGLCCAYFHDPEENVFWLSAEEPRQRVKALRRDPRASLVISSRGTDMPGPADKTLSLKGQIEIFSGDKELNIWVLKRILARYDPEPEVQESHLAANMTPGRCTLKFTPEMVTNAFDGDKTSQ